ncbi:MAG: putative 4-mercaptohistidine N1-methyltransferase [Desulfuromonas sp.]|nr:MAG: putative 4-mercaptohistidine N1-methyltransferase [Desulfuromonas sp.]
MMPLSFLSRRVQTNCLQSNYSRYQSDEVIAQYCDAHYGPDKLGVGNFSRQIAQRCFEHLEAGQQQSALVLGCAVGRTAFELATRFRQVTGVDFSSRFIDIANRLKKTGRLHYKLINEGELLTDHGICLADFKLDKTADRVTFRQSDAQDLEPTLTGYDLVVAANLIDRLPDPGSFLSGIHERIAVNGVLLLASPNDWQEKYTPKKKWLGGYFRNGRAVKSYEQLQKKLAKHFESVNEPIDIEFTLRKTARTFSHGISQVTVWRKRGYAEAVNKIVKKYTLIVYPIGAGELDFSLISVFIEPFRALCVL